MPKKTMRRAVLAGPRKVELQEVAIPEAGPDQVLVRVRACALCTWEQRVFAGIDDRFYPLLGGHEVSGVVETVGSGVDNPVSAGDRVAVALLKRCGQCYACRRGYNNICDHARRAVGKGEIAGPGGLSEYVVAQGYQVFKVSDDLPFVEACLSEPLACVLRSVKKVKIEYGDFVVIVGAGIMGLFHLLLAKQRGATVMVSEISEARLAKARELGADFTINPEEEDLVGKVKELTSGQGAEVIIAAIGAGSAIEAGVRAAAKGGRVQIFAAIQPRGTTITLDPDFFHHREIVLTGTMSQSWDDFRQATEVLSNRIIDVKPLISKVHPLEEIEQAFEEAISLNTYRVVVTMD
ncbi:MAG: zinc-binding dehydrogenase [Anaerolineae bacterium]